MSMLSLGHSRPTIDNATCLNRIQRKHPCSVCADLCPRGVFSMDPKKENQWERCTDCNLCVAACPSRCFAPSAERQKRLKEDLDLNAPVSFGCREEETLCTVRMSCITAVPWELIAACALYTDVTLYLRACTNCRDEKKKQAVSALLEKLERFLGPERFAERVRLMRTDGEEGPEAQTAAEKPEKKILSRRAVFSGIGERFKTEAFKAAARRLPFLEETEDNGMQYRMLLAKAVQQEQQRDPDFLPGVSLPQYTTACTGCGICEKLCPQKAIEFGEEQEGERTAWLTPWKCTDCELCVKACPYGGISGMHTARVPRMTQVALVRIRTERRKTT